MNLFKDIIPSLLHGKTPVLDSDEDLKSYDPFMVNRALSYYPDCMPFVQEMNTKIELPKRMQHDFYFYGLRKYKRQHPGKWAKKIEDKNDDIKLIMTAMQCNYERAKQVLPLLNDEILVKLHEEFEYGGQF